MLTDSPLADLQLEPAHTLRPRRTCRSRAWESQHKARSFRIDPDTIQRLHDIQRHYARAGYTISLDSMADELLAYAADAWDLGLVQLYVAPSQAERQPVGKVQP